MSAPFSDDDSGSVHVSGATGSSWTRGARIVGAKGKASYLFGTALALSADSKQLAVVGSIRGSLVNGAHLYSLAGTAATPDGYLLGEDGDEFGEGFAWSSDGKVLMVAANHANRLAGVVYRYERKDNWQRVATIEPPVTKRFYFGQGLLLSADGKTLFASSQNYDDGGGSVFELPVR